MQFVPADRISLLIFLIINAVVLGCVLYSVRKSKNIKLGILLWAFAFSLISLSGILDKKPFPILPLMMFAMIFGVILFIHSKVGRQLSVSLSVFQLIAFQSFRFPLELVLHRWSNEGVIPETMTWTGRNFDIISGLFALIVLPWVSRSKPLAWTFNIIGLMLLINVCRVAILSSPLPFSWHTNPPLLLAMHFPYNLILPICVSGALAGHIILTHKLSSGLVIIF